MTRHTASIAGALEQFQAGRIQDAERVCRGILEQKPDHAEALHLLGVVCHRLGNGDSALDYLPLQ